MKLASSLELYGYWDALRGARSAPERNDIEPGSIRSVLADTFILEFTPQQGFPFRLVGSRTNAMFCRELRGQSFLSLWGERAVDEVAWTLEGAADGAEPFVLGARGRPAGMAPIDFEVLLLPLRHHGATHARVLGCLAPVTSEPWFGLLPIGQLELTTLRALGGEPVPGFKVRRAVSAQVTRRRHLFVYSAAQSSS